MVDVTLESKLHVEDYLEAVGREGQGSLVFQACSDHHLQYNLRVCYEVTGAVCMYPGNNARAHYIQRGSEDVLPSPKEPPEITVNGFWHIEGAGIRTNILFTLPGHMMGCL